MDGGVVAFGCWLLRAELYDPNSDRKPGGGTVDDAYRSTFGIGKERTAMRSRAPVLARLPDVSDETVPAQTRRSAAFGATNYRFDRAQDRELEAVGPASLSVPGMQPRTGSSHQPHAFGRTRVHRRIPKRESPILPRSNPFAIPSARLIDSVAPAIRFITLVALFTAAGIWLQSMSSRSSSTSDAQPKEQPQTASQIPAAPTDNTIAPQPPRPTAAGPLETRPQSGARVGRAGRDDFIGQSESSRDVLPVDHPMKTPPRFLIATGSHVPRVQTSELPAAQIDETAVNAEPTQLDQAEEAESVARYPGFSIETPTR